MIRKLAITAMATLLSVSAAYAREWVKLGERHVGFISDHDIIEVGGHEGRFKRLKLFVRGNDIELNSIRILFGNGEVEDIVLHEHIHDGGESPTITLRTPWHEGRFIRAVELHYHSRPDFRGEAIAELWGQED